ncbi:MAG: hypothetical protein COV36_02435 [Alphaproteobacteria bacterium CG11_big_fil_rev_8_21_14_0_20_44_7]|nr:MAG: hypothetical protein COV36_02435 [Alphaproteobacteria bacterium CG11_big_fil_rev_8_21_14_0_20_44_7]
MNLFTVKKAAMVASTAIVLCAATPEAASAYSTADFFSTVTQGNLSEIQQLVEKIKQKLSQDPRYADYEVNLDLRDVNGNTPLMTAAGAGHLDVVQYLISQGADMRLVNNYGQNAAMLANSAGYTDVSNYLLTGQQPAYYYPAKTETRRTPSGHYEVTTHQAPQSKSDSGLLSTNNALILGGGVVAVGGLVAFATAGGSGSSVSSGGGSGGGGTVIDTSNIDNPASDTPADFDTAESDFNEGIAASDAYEAYARGYDGRVYNRNTDGSLVDSTADDNIEVAIIDSGVDMDHTDLAANVLTAKARECDLTSCSAGGEDDDGHGTAVAGVVAAIKDNVGIHGIAPQAKIIPIKADLLYADIHAMNYAVTAGADVINGSYGITDGLGNEIPIVTATARLGTAGTASTPTEVKTFLDTTHNGETYREAFQNIVDEDRVMVFAAGNGYMDQVGILAGLPYYFQGNLVSGAPAGYSTVNPEKADWSNHFVAAVSVDDSNVISTFSNYCGVAKEWCIAAPGQIARGLDLAGGYQDDINGTSFAAPNVAGAIAVLLGAFPHLATDDVVQILFNTATDLGATGVDEIYGHGLLDLEAATNPSDTGWDIAVTSLASGYTSPVSLSGIHLSSAFGDALARSNHSLMFMDSYKKDYHLPLAALAGRISDKKPADFYLSKLGNSEFTQSYSLSNGSKVSFNQTSENRNDITKPEAFRNDNKIDVLAYSHTIKDGENLINARFNYNRNTADALRELNFANSSINQLVVTDSFKNPYLSLADNASSAFTSYDTEKSSFTLGLYAGDNRENEFEFSESAGVRGLLGQFDYTPEENLNFYVQTGMNVEENTFLGSETGGAFRLADDSVTYYTGVGMNYGLSDNLSLMGNYNFGITDIDTSSNSLFTNFGNIHTSSFSFGAEYKNMFAENDNFVALVSQPIRVEKASATARLPYDIAKGGEVLFNNSDISLTPEGREFDLETYYHMNLNEDSDLMLGSIFKFQPEHDASQDMESLLMLKYRLSY